MNKKYLQNPFNALYQDETLLSDRAEIKELDQYARDLESQIEGDFNLEYLSFEFAYNQLAFVRNGLLLAKIKFLKLYKNYGDGTFASFCKYQLKKQRWQINDTIKAARVVLELMYAGFDILPTNISQAVTLAQLAGEELIEKWQTIINALPLDKITAKNIRNLIFPPTEDDKAVVTIKVPALVHENIHREAADRGLSIVDLIVMMLDLFVNGNATSIFQGEETLLKSGVNSHLFNKKNNIEDYMEKERIWQQDLANLAKENQLKKINF